MKKKLELPLVTPIFGTYHYQGNGCAIIASNPSIRNWYLNEAVMLSCTKKFLKGYTTPEIGIAKSSVHDNPHLERYWYGMRFFNGYINTFIRELLDNGYYVCFGGIDDYYIEGKTWYKQRHFEHDGMICGYDQEKKTYSIYAYDVNWVYKKFTTSQKAFNQGRLAKERKGEYGHLFAIKPLDTVVEFDPETALNKIEQYIKSNLKTYPKNSEETAYGAVVQDYIVMYIDKLIDGSVSHEHMDYRVFRVIWEHKKAMLERIQKIEITLNMDTKASDTYKSIVRDSDSMRMMYAAHHLKERSSILPIIKDKLISVKNREKRILSAFIKKAREAMGNDTMGTNKECYDEKT